MKRVLIVVVAILAGTSWASSHQAFHHPNGASWAQPSEVTCGTVRAYVSQFGLERARAIAVSYGMTAGQERRARQCLARRN